MVEDGFSPEEVAYYKAEREWLCREINDRKVEMFRHLRLEYVENRSWRDRRRMRRAIRNYGSWREGR